MSQKLGMVSRNRTNGGLKKKSCPSTDHQTWSQWEDGPFLRKGNGKKRQWYVKVCQLYGIRKQNERKSTSKEEL